LPQQIGSPAPSRRDLVFDSQAALLWGAGSIGMEDDMDARSQPQPPRGEGTWTLLQSRADRSFWQQTRTLTPERSVTWFVISRPPEQLSYDSFDEAEAMFRAMDED